MILGDGNNDDVADDDEANDADFDENNVDDKERYCVQREESPPTRNFWTNRVSLPLLLCRSPAIVNM